MNGKIKEETKGDNKGEKRKEKKGEYKEDDLWLCLIKDTV